MNNEAKDIINTFFKDFNSFIRHMFSGIVAVFLFEIGNSGTKTLADLEAASDITPSKIVIYALAALVVGNLTYILSRYTICAYLMKWCHKHRPPKYSRGLEKIKSEDYFVEIGDFAQYRWSENFSPKLDEYLIRAWGWIHGMGSVAIVLILIPIFFINKTPFKGLIGWACMITGTFLLFFPYRHHILLLLSMEHIAYIDYKKQKRKESKQNPTLDTTKTANQMTDEAKNGEKQENGQVANSIKESGPHKEKKEQ